MKHSPEFLALVRESRAQVKECSIDDARAVLGSDDSPTLIDVREESEFAAGHIVGAMHLSKGIIERDIEIRFPDPQSHLLLYCGGGYRSALAADNLQKMGYINIVSMDGGYHAWIESGYPIEK
jgi:rhodanese-related sulfurtransferase